MFNDSMKLLSRPISLLALVVGAVCMAWATAIGSKLGDVVAKGSLAFLATMSLVGLISVWVVPVVGDFLYGDGSHTEWNIAKVGFAVLTYGMFIAWFPVYLL